MRNALNVFQNFSDMLKCCELEKIMFQDGDFFIRCISGHL